MNALSHFEQEKGVLRRAQFSTFSKSLCCANALTNFEEAFSCVDQFIFFKWALYVNALSHFEQDIGFFQEGSIEYCMCFQVTMLCKCLDTF